MEITIIRHGKTHGNKIGRYNGTIDDPLCEEGMLQAKNAGSMKRVKHVFVTPLSRTQQTASICFENASQTVVEGLREMCFGDFEGRTADEMKDDKAYIAWLESNWALPCPNGESRTEFSMRVSKAFGEIVDLCLEKGEKEAFVVAHGGTIMGIMSTLTRSPNDYFDYFCQNCTGYKITIDKELWQSERKFSDFERVDRLSD